jgi:hypothetical protein
MSKYQALWEYLQKQKEPTLELFFAEIQKIIGFEIDHSFLTYKKELTQYGYQVEKISLKGKTIRFKKLNNNKRP